MGSRILQRLAPALLFALALTGPAYSQVAFQVATDPYELQRTGGCYQTASCGQPCYGCCGVSTDTCTFCEDGWARTYACDARAELKKFDCNGNEITPPPSPFTHGTSCLNNCGVAGCDGKTPESVCQDARNLVSADLTASGFIGSIKDLRTQAMIDAGCCAGDADGDGVPSCLDCNDNNPNVGLKVDLDRDGVTACAGDCDDHDARRHPGNLETCDGVDNDCNAAVDDGDIDGDGVLDCADNCKYTANPTQIDFNGVEGGDACTKPECIGDPGNSAGVADLSCGQSECAKSAGNPIDVVLAEKRETIPTLSLRFYDMDVSVPLTYRSRSDVDVGLGPGWTHPWAMTLSPYTNSGGVEKVAVLWKDGTRRFFRSADAGSTWSPEKANFGTLVKGSNTWTLTGEDGWVYTFDSEGRLSKRERTPGESNPVVMSFTGDKPSRPASLRILNQSFSFSYYPAATGAAGKKKGKLQMIQRVSSPVVTWTFDYDADGNLASIQQPDGKSWQLIYSSEGTPYNTSNGGDPHNLTRIMDPDGHLYALFSYDSQDRAVMSTRAGGVGKVTTSYSGLEATVTNAQTPPGVTTYGMAHDSGTGAETLSVTGTGCGTCGAGVTETTDTDPSGRVTREVSREGRETDFGTFDARGNPQTATEAPGTPQERSTSFTYHPVLRAPLSVARPSLLQTGGTAYTIFDYEPTGGPNYKSDTTVLANPGLTNADFNDPARIGNLLLRKIEIGWTRSVSGSIVPFSTITKFGYNTANGNVLETVDGPLTDSADTASISHDTYGQADSFTQPVVGTTQMPLNNYNGPFVLPGRIIDPNGATTDIAYDKFARVTSLTVPGFAGKKTEYTYDGLGRVDFVKLPRGNFIDYAYDDAGRLTDITRTASQPPAPPTLPQGERIHYTYDDEGNLTKTEVFASGGSLSRMQEFAFDALNRLQDAKNPAFTGAKSTFEYDADNNRTKVKVLDASAALLRQSRFAYDALARLTDVYQAKQITPSLQEANTHYTYDAQDNLASVTDARGHTTSYSYDDLGRLLKVTSPDTQVTRYEYDSAGNVVKKIETNLAEQGSANVETDYSYDAASRLTSIHFPSDSSQDITYVYDNRSDGPTLTNGKGRLVKITDASGVTYFSYDPAGNLTNETRVQDGVTLALSYGWDENRNLLSMTYPSGRTVTYTYDTNDRPTQVLMSYQSQNTTLASGLAYDPFGPLTGLTTGDGLTETRTFDVAGQIDTLHLAPSTGPALLDLNYTFDETANITSIADTLDASKNKTYGYDLLDRLTTAGIGGLGNFSYSYDPTGNRTQAVEPQGTTDYTIKSTNNQIDSLSGAMTGTFTYNAHGDTSSDGTKSFSYNLTHQLIQAAQGATTLGTYQYDGLSRRTARTVQGKKRLYVYGGHYDPMGEYDDAGNLLREYFYLGTLRLALAEHDLDDDAVRDEADNCLTASNATQADQDADTLGDACDAAPANPDRDGDTLLDGQEDKNKNGVKDADETDPNLADTDGDGFSDGVEVAQGSDPLDPNSTPNGNVPTLGEVAAAVLILALLGVGGWATRKRWPRGTTWAGLLLLAAGAPFIAPTPLKSQGGPAERIVYIHTDHLGTPLLLTDEDRQVVWRGRAEPFGETTPSVNQVVFNLRFPGQYEDRETGLFYNNARSYSPEHARYTTPDPFGLAAGLNLYTYSNNNTLKYVDPNGRTPAAALALCGGAPEVCIVLGLATAITIATSGPGAIHDIGRLIQSGSDDSSRVGARFDLLRSVGGNSSTGDPNQFDPGSTGNGQNACSDRSREAGKGRVVIGENMARVQRYADEIGAETFKGTGMAENRAFIQQAVREGKEVLDIGPDFSRRLTRTLEGQRPNSTFYNMERMETRGYGAYRRVFERSGRFEGGVPGLDY